MSSKKKQFYNYQIRLGKTNFYLPKSVPVEVLLHLLTEATPCMIKSGQNLKLFYNNSLIQTA